MGFEYSIFYVTIYCVCYVNYDSALHVIRSALHVSFDRNLEIFYMEKRQISSRNGRKTGKRSKYADSVFPVECSDPLNCESPIVSDGNGIGEMCNAPITAELMTSDYAPVEPERISPIDAKASELLRAHALQDSKAARDLAALYIKAGVPELFDIFGEHFSRFEATLAHEANLLESYYKVLEKKIARLMKRKRGATTGQIQRLAIAMSKIISTSRAAFGLPYGAIDPHKIKQAGPSQLSVTLHNHGGADLAPIDVTPRKD